MTSPAIVMEHQPLKTVDDEFTAGRDCAVCGETALRVVHVEKLPDYVKCANCESAFILSETADWALYGTISADYPETQQVAVKRWTTLEAVHSLASSERLPKAESDGSSDTTPPFGTGGSERVPTPPFGIGAGTTGAEQASTPPFGLSELDEYAAESSNGSSAPEVETPEPLEERADVSEPEPGHRYLVTLAQKAVELPNERCAHCLRRPALRNLLVRRDPDLEYQVPLCESCYGRASAGSEEQRTAKIIAHLSSILVAGLLIVVAIAVGLISFSDISVLDVLLIGTIALVGYGLPAILLLGRSSDLPPSDDAQFVRSTLRIREHDGLVFGWRNRGYAELFSAANEDQMLGELTRVSESA